MAKTNTNESGGGLVTRAELSRIWGISRAGVTSLFNRDGAPRFVNGKITRAAAEAWRAQRKQKPELIKADAGMAEAKRRQEVMKANLLELEYKTKLGEYMPRAEVEAIAREDGARLRAALMAFPSRVAPMLADAAAAGGVPAVAAALEAEVRRMLEALASFKSLDFDE
jgi:hypothetical protein